MAFRIHLQDHKVWRKIIEAVSAVTDQAVFKATPKGIQMRMMDPIRVMMLDLDLPAEVFTEYNCTEEMKLAFNLEAMDKILKRGQPNDAVTFESTTVKKENKLLITFQGSMKRAFTLPLLDLSFEDLPLPKGDSGNVSAKLTFDAFEVAVKDAAVPYGSDQVTIAAVDHDALTMRANGDTTDVVDEFRRGSEALLDLEVKEKASARYGINYLGDMLKTSGLSETALLQFNTDMPLKVTVQMPEGGRLTYYLAPRKEA
jgi:proliferating cell nuclear antigen